MYYTVSNPHTSDYTTNQPENFHRIFQIAPPQASRPTQLRPKLPSESSMNIAHTLFSNSSSLGSLKVTLNPTLSLNASSRNTSAAITQEDFILPEPSFLKRISSIRSHVQGYPEEKSADSLNQVNLVPENYHNFSREQPSLLVSERQSSTLPKKSALKKVVRFATKVQSHEPSLAASSYNVPSRLNSAGTVTDMIKEEVIRDKEMRKSQELNSMREQLRRRETIGDILNNEKERKATLQRSDALLAECKQYLQNLQAAVDVSKKCPTCSSFYDEGQDQNKSLNHSRVLSQSRVLDQSQVLNQTLTNHILEASMVANTLPNRAQEQSFTVDYQPILAESFYVNASQDAVNTSMVKREFKNPLNQMIMDDVRKAREVREKREANSIREMLDSGCTITDMVANEKRRNHELSKSRIISNYLKESLTRPAF